MTKYNRGAVFEREVVRCFQFDGALAFRCAGSKGNALTAKVDVIAIYPHEPPILIQCKLHGAISKKEKENLRNVAASFHCSAYLASKDEKGKFQFDVLHRAST